MAFCHGKGNISTDGCCWVNGAICPLRWKIIDGVIYEGPNLVNKGTVVAYAQSITNNKSAQDKIIAQATNITFACKAAVEVLVAQPALLNNRAGFETAWNNHAGYVAQVRPHWSTVEQNLGLPANSYNCSSWTGVNTGECCYAEDEATNATKCGTLSSEAVTIRSQRNRPSS